MKYFRLDEFDCPCCGKNEMQEDFLRRLDAARDLAKMPFYITSGYRCEKRNRMVGGKADSAHLRGRACDIVTLNSNERFKVINALCEAGFKRIGIKENFIHVDFDLEKSQKVCWLYG